MKRLMWTGASLALVVSCLAIGQVSADQRQDEAAIRQVSAAYAQAFHRRDAKALAALWAPAAVYVSPISNRKVTGRAAIEAEFARMFQESGEARLAIVSESLRFIGAGVAIEDGRANVTRPGETATESSYTAIFVKADGKWLLDSVRETVLPPPPRPASS